MTTVGVVGLGYWGPNLARNFDRLPGSELAWLCDASEEALARYRDTGDRRARDGDDGGVEQIHHLGGEHQCEDPPAVRMADQPPGGCAGGEC